jgi:hypothetical protein
MVAMTPAIMEPYRKTGLGACRSRVISAAEKPIVSSV